MTFPKSRGTWRRSTTLRCPDTQFQWEGRNRIRIRTTAAPGQALSVQVSYHPGWHATVAGQPRELRKDGLGLMWLRPGRSGPVRSGARLRRRLGTAPLPLAELARDRGTGTWWGRQSCLQPAFSRLDRSKAGPQPG